MKIEFMIKGLNCAHCASEIEQEIRKQKGINSANVNMIRERITVDCSAEMEKHVFPLVESIVHSHEPEVTVQMLSQSKTHNVHHSEEHAHDHHGDQIIIPRMLIGGILFIGGIIIESVLSIHPWIQQSIFLLAYIILGYDVLLQAIRNLIKGRILDENFLMSIASVGAFCIGESHEAVAVMLLYQIGEHFQSRAVQQSRKSISDLMDIRPDHATVLRFGRCVSIPAEEVFVGESILVKPGEKIPLDGQITDGTSLLDTSALTGESLPREVFTGDPVLSGCINLNSALTIRVTATFHESTASRIIDMVENATAKKAKAENFISVFAKYYTPIVVITAAILGLLPPLLQLENWQSSLHRAFVFLVISCPCALVISVPLAYFAGIGAASKKGILVKGGNYLEALSKLDTVVMDKTGTLTTGSFSVSTISPAANYSQDALLQLAAQAECYSNHPIAESIRKASHCSVSKKEISAFQEIPGKGITATVNGKRILAGNEQLMKDFGISFDIAETPGTKLYIAEDEQYAGYILISDTIKSDSKSTVSSLFDAGVQKIVMLTGDNQQIAKSVADRVGIQEFYSELLPADKLVHIEQIISEKNNKRTVAFVGDGINDAPVLARADIGISMGGLGSDAAIEASDVVIMTDEPSKIVEAIKTARKTHRIVVQNIIFSIAIKVIFLVLGALGYCGMWEAVFADVGVCLIAVANSMRLLKK